MSPRSIGLLASLAVAACAEPADYVAVSLAPLRPDSPNTTEPPPVFTSTDMVERYDSLGGSFRIHYTRAGQHAVPAGDANGDGVPDSVAEVAMEYDAVGDFYADTLGFERPLSDANVTDGNGGDGRFDVYLLDFPTAADGAFRREECTSAAFRCTGYMLHENDFNNRNYPSRARANRILASHEYFHAIQATYNARAGVVLGEGTAVWASEQYDPTLGDLEGFVDGYLERTDRSLTQEPTGPVDPFAYGSSLFFQFLSERYGRETIRALWEALAAEGATVEPQSWARALDAVLQGQHDSALAEAFAEFARWNLYTGSRADPSKAYQRGDGYSEPALEEVALPFDDETVRMFPLAVRYYTARVREAGPVRFALRSDASLDGLRLVLARASGDRIEEIELADAGAATAVTLAAANSGEVIYAALINTRTSGESVRPDVCLGAPEDLDRCGGADAGAEDRDAGPDASSDEASGCSVGGVRNDAPSDPAWWCLVFLLRFARTQPRRR